jgi:hypothetical protein
MERKIWGAVLLLVGCQHQDRSGVDLDKLKTNPNALEAARATAATECRPTGAPSDACCTAMMEEGDALWAQGQKQPAWRAFNEVRGRCPMFAPVRRHMFAVRKVLRPAGEPAPAAVTVGVNVTVDTRLGENARLVGYQSYFDGERVVQGAPMPTTAGLHEVMTELYLEARKPGELPVRLDAVAEVELPAELASESRRGVRRARRTSRLPTRCCRPPPAACSGSPRFRCRRAWPWGAGCRCSRSVSRRRETSRRSRS